MMVRLGGLVFAFGAVALTGCGSSAAKQALPKTSPGHALIVEDTVGTNPDAWYDPTPLRITVGGTITWTNRDQEPHDATSFAAGFSSGPIPTGGSYRWTATRPGTFHYFCTLHPNMHGVIVVKRRH
jgi:plastocyanin